MEQKLLKKGNLFIDFHSIELYAREKMHQFLSLLLTAFVHLINNTINQSNYAHIVCIELCIIWRACQSSGSILFVHPIPLLQSQDSMQVHMIQNIGHSFLHPWQGIR